MIDVGFGGDGATKPIPLISGEIVHNLGTQEVRLINDLFPNSTEPAQKFWFYEYRNRKEQDWNRFYGFPELEFFQADFEVINLWTSTAPGNNQYGNVICIKFIRDGNSDAPKISGKVMLFNEQLKENLGGRTQLVKIMVSEEERVQVIQDRFGIKLTKEERESILGRHTELILKN
ncbi:hypothetical protein ABW19_dt0204682 [Dactylella cylindrospora]|nr:hypothetical protein ABW19_dt0204682 [Dactylella cylindrospora]